jgi:uncharacterized protein (TIGR03435 family)
MERRVSIPPKLIATLFSVGLLATAQTAPAPAFDVISIKPSQTARRGGEGSGREHISWTPTSVTLENASLTACIQWAYDLRFYQISGPTWPFGERYDILAKTDHPSSIEGLRLMLGTLLADRFHLAYHRARKTMTVYELLPYREGPKLQAAKAETTGIRVAGGRFVLDRMSMAGLAAFLSELAEVDRPVLDRTGIAGVFDISLPAIPRGSPEADSVSIFAAIQEELGLTLKSARAEVETLVIDRAERPSAN